MKTLFLLLAILVGHQAVGQLRDSRFESLAGVFEHRYNRGEYDSIYSMFSSSMQQHLPLVETRKFFAGLKVEAGEIHERQPVEEKFDQATYKTTFERGIFALKISLNADDEITGFVIKPYLADSLPKLERNITAFGPPFRGAWTVLWGGNSPELNHHINNQVQKQAFDFFIVGEDGKTYRSDGRTNEDYYAFGKEIIAPCNGEVVMVVDGIKDNLPGEMNPVYIPGNTVILKTPASEFLVFAHFKQKSIVVRAGEKVKQGQLLGLCGNSGNSTEPHLHFHLQNIEEMYKATGAKIYFKEILVNGKLKSEHSPVKGEVIQSVDN